MHVFNAGGNLASALYLGGNNLLEMFDVFLVFCFFLFLFTVINNQKHIVDLLQNEHAEVN